MINQDIIAQDLFYKIRGRFPSLEMGDGESMPTFESNQGRFFDFDAIFDDVNLGRVSISINEPGRLKLYFNRNILEDKDSIISKKWYDFLKEMRKFAMKRLMSFDTRDIGKTNLTKRDYGVLAQKESIMSESAMFGTSRTSYKPLEKTKLIIIHTNPVDDSVPGARSRHIKSLFVQNQDGERFKYPFIHKLGAECMLRHVANGGLPYDDIGKAIVEMSKAIAQLASFKRYVGNHDLMNSDTNHIVDRANEKLMSLKDVMRRLTKQHHYDEFKNSFVPVSTGPEIDAITMEDYKNKFTVKSFQENIADVFPLLHSIMQENNELKLEDLVSEQQVDEELDENIVVAPEDQFNEWADDVVENALDIGVNEDNLDHASGGPQVEYMGGNQFQVVADGQTYTVTADTARDGREYDDPVQWVDVEITDAQGQPVENPVMADEVEEILNNQFGEQAMEHQSDRDIDAGDAAYDSYRDSQYEGIETMQNEELSSVLKLAGLPESNDGNLANNAKPYDKVTRGDVIAGRLGKDEMGGKEEKVNEYGGEDQTQEEKRHAMEYLQNVARAIKSGEVQPEEIEAEFFDTLPMLGVSDEKTFAAWDRITGGAKEKPQRAPMSDKEIDAEIGNTDSGEDDDAAFLARLRGQAKSGSIKTDNTGFGAENEGIENQVGAPAEDIEQDEKNYVAEKDKQESNLPPEIEEFIEGFFDAENDVFPLGVEGVLTKTIKEFEITAGSEEANEIEEFLISKNTGGEMRREREDAFEDIRKLAGLKALVEGKKKGDGNLANNAKPYDKVTRGDVIAGRLGKDEEGGKKAKNESNELDDIRALSGLKEAKKDDSKEDYCDACDRPESKCKCDDHDHVKEAKEDKKCNHTPKGKKCPVHGIDECMGKPIATVESKKDAEMEKANKKKK